MNIVPVLVLDLDGTVRRSKTGKFIDGPDDIELIPGIEEAIHSWKNAGYLVFGVTNQGGVAHGYKTEEYVEKEFDATRELFNEDPFNGICSATYDEKGYIFPYNHKSLLRKPNIGMLVLIEASLSSRGLFPDWNNSLVVGDSQEDAEMAERAGIKFVHINDFL